MVRFFEEKNEGIQLRLPATGRCPGGSLAGGVPVALCVIRQIERLGSPDFKRKRRIPLCGDAPLKFAQFSLKPDQARKK